MQKIVLLTTGGTIEKSFDPRTGRLSGFENKVKQHVESLRLPWFSVEVDSVLCKDSLEITQGDRELLLGAIRERLVQPCPIVVTHGTDTAVETGRFLHLGLPELSVPIVLTGAVVPLGFDGSDGPQNLVQSLMAARLLRAGVFLVMHGEAYPIHCVEKLAQKATFTWTCSHEWHRHGQVNGGIGPSPASLRRHQ